VVGFPRLSNEKKVKESESSDPGETVELFTIEASGVEAANNIHKIRINFFIKLPS
jgi:hypothetical protein